MYINISLIDDILAVFLYKLKYLPKRYINMKLVRELPLYANAGDIEKYETIEFKINKTISRYLNISF
jgi:hypothetical protein